MRPIITLFFILLSTWVVKSQSKTDLDNLIAKMETVSDKDLATNGLTKYMPKTWRNSMDKQYVFSKFSEWQKRPNQAVQKTLFQLLKSIDPYHVPDSIKPFLFLQILKENARVTEGAIGNYLHFPYWSTSFAFHPEVIDTLRTIIENDNNKYTRLLPFRIGQFKLKPLWELVKNKYIRNDNSTNSEYSSTKNFVLDGLAVGGDTEGAGGVLDFVENSNVYLGERGTKLLEIAIRTKNKTMADGVVKLLYSSISEKKCVSPNDESPEPKQHLFFNVYVLRALDMQFVNLPYELFLKEEDEMEQLKTTRKWFEDNKNKLEFAKDE
jgi:hypothetical protein